MISETQVVVIGGGVVGCSILYHLTKAGWTDVVLLERKELTAGSTWHAAGGMHTLNHDPDVAKLQQYTVELYKDIEKISGQDCGIHLTGGLLLADTEERMDWLRMAHARGRYLGMDTELISIAEAKEMFPLLDESYFVGAMYDVYEGHVDPSGVTHAYAKAAQKAGATIYKQTMVEALSQRADKTWDVRTNQGDIHTEHVVNAGGLWAREVGRMAGLELPILAMEHMYLLTEPMQEVADFRASTGKELPGVMDFGGELYLREEQGGMLMGTYEQAGVPWSPHHTPWSFGSELLTPDMERIAPSLEVGFAHYPAFEGAGISRVINGPFTFAPDGNPCIGPVKGLPNYWAAVGIMAGLSQGGGVGLALANWITEGDPGMDIWAMDIARFGDWATMAYTNAKVRENYSRRFRITFPNEELPAGRPLNTTALYDRLSEHNAVWGASYGLEHPLWFQDHGKEPIEDVTFRRSNRFNPVAAEVRAVRESVGLSEISAFAKYDVTGPGAADWLGRVLANRVPDEGRLNLNPMLNHRGKLIGDFTVANLGGGDFRVFGSGVAETTHMRWFLENLPADGSVRIRALGQQLAGISIAGPNSRTLLADLVTEDVGAESFRFMDIRKMDLGMIPALVGRLTYTGDLGYEIWVGPENLRGLFDLLMDAGAVYDIRPFGFRALDSMRFDKNFGCWALEFRPIYGPAEAGLDRFVNLAKGPFIGREAVLAEKEQGPERRLVAFVVDADDADVSGDEPIWHNNEVVGWVTSGAYAHWSEASMALGYVPAALAGETSGFEIEVIGNRRESTIQPTPLFDPQRLRMKG
ncbi:MAG: FAD-dependent oxidoreductase [bacterium]|nr:FAD-dependent oxidoreductase [bacterium]